MRVNWCCYYFMTIITNISVVMNLITCSWIILCLKDYCLRPITYIILYYLILLCYYYYDHLYLRYLFVSNQFFCYYWISYLLLESYNVIFIVIVVIISSITISLLLSPSILITTLCYYYSHSFDDILLPSHCQLSYFIDTSTSPIFITISKTYPAIIAS